MIHLILQDPFFGPRTLHHAAEEEEEEDEEPVNEQAEVRYAASPLGVDFQDQSPEGIFVGFWLQAL